MLRKVSTPTKDKDPSQFGNGASAHPHLYTKFLFGTILIACTLLICAVAVELILRTFPQHLPFWYRSSFPLSGIELFHPGILERTPISGVPLPYDMSGRAVFTGPTPQDLQALGLVSSEANPDREKYPEVLFRKDENGLPNPTERSQADVLLVGDSFVLAAGVLFPPGFQAKVQDRTKLSVHNLGIPGIGPQREEFMLNTLGLQLRPRAVIWFFFGGNDIDEALRLEETQKKGVRNYAQLFPGFVYPKSYLVDLIKEIALKSSRAQFAKKKMNALPPFLFNTTTQAKPIWFSPLYLRNSSYPRSYWEAHPGLEPTQKILARTSAALKDQGIRMLLVYVPSKPQIYLSYVERNALLLHQMASFGLDAPLSRAPDGLWESSLENCDSLEQVLATFAEREGIDYLSLSSHFREAARAGSLCFLSADTHWNDVGQDIAVEPAVDWLKKPLSNR